MNTWLEDIAVKRTVAGQEKVSEAIAMLKDELARLDSITTSVSVQSGHRADHVSALQRDAWNSRSADYLRSVAIVKQLQSACWDAKKIAVEALRLAAEKVKADIRRTQEANVCHEKSEQAVIKRLREGADESGGSGDVLDLAEGCLPALILVLVIGMWVGIAKGIWHLLTMPGRHSEASWRERELKARRASVAADMEAMKDRYVALRGAMEQINGSPWPLVREVLLRELSA